MVRNFPTHGQQSAAQAANCLSTLTLPFKLLDSSALWTDGPEVEHGAHFLILHYPPTRTRGVAAVAAAAHALHACGVRLQVDVEAQRHHVVEPQLQHVTARRLVLPAGRRLRQWLQCDVQPYPCFRACSC